MKSVYVLIILWAVTANPEITDDHADRNYSDVGQVAPCKLCTDSCHHKGYVQGGFVEVVEDENLCRCQGEATAQGRADFEAKQRQESEGLLKLSQNGNKMVVDDPGNGILSGDNPVIVLDDNLPHGFNTEAAPNASNGDPVTSLRPHPVPPIRAHPVPPIRAHPVTSLQKHPARTNVSIGHDGILGEQHGTSIKVSTVNEKGDKKFVNSESRPFRKPLSKNRGSHPRGGKKSPSPHHDSVHTEYDDHQQRSDRKRPSHFRFDPPPRDDGPRKWPRTPYRFRIDYPAAGNNGYRWNDRDYADDGGEYPRHQGYRAKRRFANGYPIKMGYQTRSRYDFDNGYRGDYDHDADIGVVEYYFPNPRLRQVRNVKSWENRLPFLPRNDIREPFIELSLEYEKSVRPMMTSSPYQYPPPDLGPPISDNYFEIAE